VCLFTAVGGVMLLVFCLIIIQECKVFYVWVVQHQREEVQPPAYIAVTKTPTYVPPGWRPPDGRRVPPEPYRPGYRPESRLSEETEPPAYSELYTRENSEMDRIVICDGVSTLVHSATLADVSVEGLFHDQTEDTQNYRESGLDQYNRDSMTETAHQGCQHELEQDQTCQDLSEQEPVKPKKDIKTCSRAKTFQSMLALGSPRRGKNARQYTSLQLFRLSSASSSSDSFSDSVPLIDRTDRV